MDTMWEPGQYSILFNKVEGVLDEIRPAMRKDGGDCDLIEITPDGVVKLRLIGACGKCPMSFMTLSMGIETKIKASIPEVKKVVSIEDAGCSHNGSSGGSSGGLLGGLLRIGKANK
jgi:Fe-S cluster biogenesis protein NfuA